MIFEDPSRKRWKIVLTTFISLVVLALVLLGLSLASVIKNPSLPGFQQLLQGKRKSMDIRDKLNQQGQVKPKTNKDWAQSSTSTQAHVTSTLGILPKQDRLVLAYLVQEDSDSLKSFEIHSPKIDVVSPNWYFVNSVACEPMVKIDPKVQQSISASGVPAMPMVTNGDDKGWHKNEVQAIIHNQTMRNCLADSLAQKAIIADYYGLNIDIEELEDTDQADYVEFLKELADKLHQAGKKLVVNISTEELKGDPQPIAEVADSVMVMAYDEHYAAGEPGSIAGFYWYIDMTDLAQDQIPAQKLIMGIGAYGYDWKAGSKQPAEVLKYSEAMSLAKDVEANPQLDNQTLNMYFGYEDEYKDQHTVWFLDAVSDWNLWRSVKDRNLPGVGLWRLGQEDQNVWKYLGNSKASSTGLGYAQPLDAVAKLDEGEVIALVSKPEPGQIDVKYDTDGIIDEAEYLTVPSGYIIDRFGDEEKEKDLVLTFDDGPDPEWTPKIMEVLKKEGVPAVFFVVGEQAQKYPALVEQMAQDGFMVGNHTYLHPNLSIISPERIRLEVNATERIIQAAYGKRTMLFRAPYDTDAMPSNPEQLKPLEEIAKLGYVIVGASIDSNDWEKPGVDKIVSDVETQIGYGGNHIIVMHDAGGDRSQTLEALKKLIPDLRSKGYEFVSLDKAINIPSEQLMPELLPKERAYIESMKAVNTASRWFWIFIAITFTGTTVLAILRLLSMGYLALRGWRREKETGLEIGAPQKVTVLIPAYNEEKVIAKTLDSLRHTEGIRFEAIVIDDGSKDRTSEVAQSIADQDKRIRVITKLNGGKSSALNIGFEQATSDIVVTIDADTVLLPQTLKHLARPFADPEIDAVSGNVVVGNINRLLTGFQALEYITAQNFDRRAFDELNAISVVPGATGAWRRQKVLDLGGYHTDTLAEDTDLTMRLLAQGGKVVYAPEAVSLTEAPEKVSALYKQRFRWSYGTFQCLFKNRRSLFKGPLGRVAMPNIIMFQIIFPLLAPLGDLIFILSIIQGNLALILLPYLAFTLLDLVGSAFAFSLEDTAPKKLLWLVLLQRFFYRQFMYVVIWRSLIAMLRGRRQGWNKLKRLGSVSATP